MNQISDPFSNHISQLSSSASKLSGFNSSLFDFASQGMSPSRTQPLPASPLVNAFSISPSNTGSLSEVRVCTMLLRYVSYTAGINFAESIIRVYVCHYAGTKAQRGIDFEPRSIGHMGRTYQSGSRSLRSVAIGERGGKKEGYYRRATEGRGKYSAL